MWVELTVARLRAAMTDQEQAALSKGDPTILDDIAANVAAEWRGGLRKVGPVDSRAGYVPDELLIHILPDFRFRAAMRLPGMKALIDDLRMEEWKRAMKVRDALKEQTFVIPDAANTESAETAGEGVELVSGDGSYPSSYQMDGLL